MHPFWMGLLVRPHQPTHENSIESRRLFSSSSPHQPSFWMRQRTLWSARRWASIQTGKESREPFAENGQRVALRCRNWMNWHERCGTIHPMNQSLALVMVAAVTVASAACNRSSGGSTPAEHSAVAPRNQAPVEGTIVVTVGEDGFAPNDIAVKLGAPATLRFTRTTNSTCATEVDFPELGIKRALPLNQPVEIEVPTTKARIIAFQCGMGMYKSKVEVR
jgi:hypothetical protein